MALGEIQGGSAGRVRPDTQWASQAASAGGRIGPDVIGGGVETGKQIHAYGLRGTDSPEARTGAWGQHGLDEDGSSEDSVPVAADGDTVELRSDDPRATPTPRVTAPGRTAGRTVDVVE